MEVTFLGREYELEKNDGAALEAYHPLAIDCDTSMTLSVVRCKDEGGEFWKCRLRWAFDQADGAVGGRASGTIERNEPTITDAVRNVDAAVRVLLRGLGTAAADGREVSVAEECGRQASILDYSRQPVAHSPNCVSLSKMNRVCDCGAEVRHLRQVVHRYEVLILLYDATVFVVRSMEHLLPDFIRSQIKACLDGHKELTGEPPMRSRYENAKPD